MKPQAPGTNQGNAAGQKDPNAIDVDRTNWGKQPPIKCYNCQGTGHMARDCTNARQARQMTYAEMKDYIEQQEALRKDKEETDRKHKAAEKGKGKAQSPSPGPSGFLEEV